MMNDGIHSGSREDAPAFLSHGRMPVAFIGHGSPENALGNNPFSNTWKRLGEMIPKPALILSISAHWVTQEGIAVTAIEHPRTIHDFYGFPDELYRIEYPAPGSLEGAKLVQNLVRSSSIGLDYEWGLDHGTWSVLRHMYPDADIPALKAFQKNYYTRFGLEPDVFACHAYDGMNIIISAIRKAGLNRVLIRDLLTDLKTFQGYQGITGKIVFDDSWNDIGDIWMAEVRQGKFRFSPSPPMSPVHPTSSTSVY